LSSRFEDPEDHAPRPPDALRVVVVGDDPLARSGLVHLLAGDGGIVVTAELEPDAASETTFEGADVVLWDLGTDAAPMLERLRDMAVARPPLVALLDEDEPVAGVLAAGARSVLPRNIDPVRLEAALRAVAADLVVIDPAWAGAAVPTPPTVAPPRAALTPRELQVLQLMAEGLPNKLIADRLRISEHTAKFHVNAILAKLDAESRTEAVVKAARLGLIAI
jgi:DNA-binding NarL/FixJ family response regulator